MTDPSCCFHRSWVPPRPPRPHPCGISATFALLPKDAWGGAVTLGGCAGSHRSPFATPPGDHSLQKQPGWCSPSGIPFSHPRGLLTPPRCSPSLPTPGSWRSVISCFLGSTGALPSHGATAKRNRERRFFPFWRKGRDIRLPWQRPRLPARLPSSSHPKRHRGPVPELAGGSVCHGGCFPGRQRPPRQQLWGEAWSSSCPLGPAGMRAAAYGQSGATLPPRAWNSWDFSASDPNRRARKGGSGTGSRTGRGTSSGQPWLQTACLALPAAAAKGPSRGPRVEPRHPAQGMLDCPAGSRGTGGRILGVCRVAVGDEGTTAPYRAR